MSTSTFLQGFIARAMGCQHPQGDGVEVSTSGELSWTQLASSEAWRDEQGRWFFHNRVTRGLTQEVWRRFFFFTVPNNQKLFKTKKTPTNHLEGARCFLKAVFCKSIESDLTNQLMNCTNCKSVFRLRSPASQDGRILWHPFSRRASMPPLVLGRCRSLEESSSRWWFHRFFIFSPTWGRFPFWLIFLGWNHQPVVIIVVLQCLLLCEVGVMSPSLYVSPFHLSLWYWIAVSIRHHQSQELTNICSQVIPMSIKDVGKLRGKWSLVTIFYPKKEKRTWPWNLG